MTEIEFESGPTDKPVRTIINSDGELLFPDGELDYDIAFQAMGGPETALIVLKKKWDDYPIPTIIMDFGVPEAVKRMLLIDSAEHVLPIFEKTAGPERSKLARRVIKQCRIVFSKDDDKEALEKLDKLVKHLGAKRGRPPAESQVYSAIYYAAGRLEAAIAFTNFNPACMAAAYDANTATEDEWDQIHKREELWQISHFVELMRWLYDKVLDRRSRPDK